MNKTGLNELKNTYNYLYKKDIYAYQLTIIDELECQLTCNITDDEYLKLFNEIAYTYLKLDNVKIESIVRCAIKNMDKILNDDNSFNLKSESCWYE